ncbi:MAG: acyltransferase [Bacteroidales bacterium]|nr:acyltransferase [Bacteroidales bacterium]
MQQQWSGKTDGTTWMQRSLIAMLRIIPCEVFYGVLLVVVPFYMLFSRKSYCAIYRYFRHRLGYGRVRAFLNVYWNHFLFGQVVIDRFAAFAGKQYKFEIDNLHLFDELVAGEGGFIMLSSHVGCYEMAGCMLTSKKKPINAVAYDGETAVVSRNRESLMLRHNMKLIPVKRDMSHLFAVNSALDRGEIVSLPADRLNGSPKTVRCMFMGEEAQFPMGPFSLARVKKVPVLAMFVMKEGSRRYHIYLSRVENAQQFACDIEATLRKYPAQWFNFYDFWNKE